MPQQDWKSRIEEAAVHVLWSHWIKLGAYVEGKSCQASGDPEALLLLTAIAAKKDLRLVEVMTQWIHHYEFLVNVERLKTALKLLPEDRYFQNFCAPFKKMLQKGLPPQSRKRWSKIFFLLNQEKSAEPESTDIISRKKIQAHDWILEHNPLLGFRHAFGATAKADILYFLSVYVDQPRVASRRPTTGATIAKILHYDPATVLRTLEDLKGARLIRSGEAPGDKTYLINSRCPIFSWQPKADRFFLDWFALVPVFRDIFSLDDEVLGRHDSLVLDRLNKRLKRLDHVLSIVPRHDPKPYAKEYFLGVSQNDLWEQYEKALDEINDALAQPRRLDWGSDRLTEFLDMAEHNLWASYAYLDEFRRLIAVDQVFAELPLDNHQNWFGGLFFMRCYSAFRAAARLAASGQLTESFALMRLALENAFYALHIHFHPESGESWIGRNNDPKSKQACKKEFQIAPLLKNYEEYETLLKDYEKHDIHNAAVARKLYEATINYGAHPNIDGFTSNLEIEDNKDDKIISTLQLNTKEIPLKHAMINVLRTGGCCLLIFENLYRDRFQSSGLSEKLRSIIHGL